MYLTTVTCLHLNRIYYLYQTQYLNLVRKNDFVKENNFLTLQQASTSSNSAVAWRKRRIPCNLHFHNRLSAPSVQMSIFFLFHLLLNLKKACPFYSYLRSVLFYLLWALNFVGVKFFTQYNKVITQISYRYCYRFTHCYRYTYLYVTKYKFEISIMELILSANVFPIKKSSYELIISWMRISIFQIYILL